MLVIRRQQPKLRQIQGAETPANINARFNFYTSWHETPSKRSTVEKPDGWRYRGMIETLPNWTLNTNGTWKRDPTRGYPLLQWRVKRIRKKWICMSLPLPHPNIGNCHGLCIHIISGLISSLFSPFSRELPREKCRAKKGEKDPPYICRRNVYQKEVLDPSRRFPRWSHKHQKKKKEKNSTAPNHYFVHHTLYSHLLPDKENLIHRLIPSFSILPPPLASYCHSFHLFSNSIQSNSRCFRIRVLPMSLKNSWTNGG